MAVRQIFLTSGTAYTLPIDCNNIKVEILGGTGFIVNNSTGVFSGAAYSQTTSLNVTRGQTIYYQIANAGGSSSWLNINSNAAPTSTSQGCLAASGNYGSSNQGGQASACIGDIKYSGGNSAAVGCGGTAGPNGAGGNAGSSGGGTGGGGGANGGSSGSNGGSSAGGAGGNNRLGTGGAAGSSSYNGNSGSYGLASAGGGGGGGGSTLTGPIGEAYGGSGGGELIWTSDTGIPYYIGAGGGGGQSVNYCCAGCCAQAGASGATYSYVYQVAGNFFAAQTGLIVITYTESTPPPGITIYGANSPVGYSGSVVYQTYVVPTGIYSITFYAWGYGGLAQIGGGGGSAFASSTFSVTPGQTIYLGFNAYTSISPGPDLTSAWVNLTSATIPANSSQGLYVDGGGRANNLTGGTGGQASNCIYNLIAYNGGNGGNATGTGSGAGGGGAAGPNGAGKNGGTGISGTSVGGGGGGGANNGYVGNNPTSGTGATGGNNRFNTGGGTATNIGTSGGGGGGGTASTTSATRRGKATTPETIFTVNGINYGPLGGGGGGARNNSSVSNGGTGPDFTSYGGGGGAGGTASTSSTTANLLVGSSALILWTATTSLPPASGRSFATIVG